MSRATPHNGASACPWVIEPAAVSLSRVQLDQLERDIQADIAAAFRRRAEPVIGPTFEPDDSRPRPVIDVRWNEITKGTFVVNVRTTLWRPGACRRTLAHRVGALVEHRFSDTRVAASAGPHSAFSCARRGP